MIIDIDVDGVLADMHNGYFKYIDKFIPNYNEYEYITDWSFTKIKSEYPIAYDVIMELHKNPYFIKSLKRIEGVERSLCELYYNILTNETFKGDRIRFHTHILEEGYLVKARQQWLEELIRDTGINAEIKISVGGSKGILEDTDILIEDNVTNLYNSSAKIKLLIKRGHNQNNTIEDLGQFTYAKKCEDFSDAVSELVKVRGMLK